MTKDQLAQEIKQEFAKGNFKPSQLKRSKSTGDIPLTPPLPNIPLKKSASQPETPQTLSPEQEISQLQSQIKFHAQTSQNYLQSLQAAQAKITELEEQLTANQQAKNDLAQQILELRLKNLKDFGEYYEEKQALKGELEENIQEGVQEIQKLENKLLALNRKKLTLQSQLQQAELKNTRLELKAIEKKPKAHSPLFNFPWVLPERKRVPNWDTVFSSWTEFLRGENAGELVFEDFINLVSFGFDKNSQITKVKFVNCPQINVLNLRNMSNLQKVEGLEHLTNLSQCSFSAQLAEYENQETTSQTSSESSYSDLASKYLRKEIELLEKIQTLETQISALQTKETNYQEQIRQKEQALQIAKNALKTNQDNLKATETNLNQTISELNTQINNLKRTSQQEKDKLTQELAALKTAKITSEKALNQTITNLRKEIESLTNTSKKEKQGLDRKINQLQTDLQAKNEAEKRLQEEKTRLEAQLTALQKEKTATQENS
ncbi:2099_t:CDS:2 [Entrophospora sp. SA101]|nr:2099_t:CDS:2 [Entrophospora sp. SA101]